jgi:hypothetical protein
MSVRSNLLLMNLILGRIVGFVCYMFIFISPFESPYPLSSGYMTICTTIRRNSVTFFTCQSVKHVKNGTIIFDSGMYEGNARNYSMWRAHHGFWDKLVCQ